MNTYTQKLALSDHLRETVMKQIITYLGFPRGSRGLDAGCGIGSHTVMLAEAIGPEGYVTGLDISPEFLKYAAEKAADNFLEDRTSFKEGNVKKIPFKDNSFDWVWSVDCIGYPIAGEGVSQIIELKRVVKNKGMIAFLTWTSEYLLPGYPLLEARLKATSAGIAPYDKTPNPEDHFMRALGWLQKASLEKPRVKTFVGEISAPIDDETRDALLSLFEMRWEGAKDEVSTEDWSKLERLTQPDSPDFILNKSDYYAIFTYTVFSGKVRK